MPAQTAPTGLRARRQKEVAQRAPLDADEESVELEKGAGERDERSVPGLRCGRSVPTGVSLIDVAMVEPGHREPPANATVNDQPGRRARVEQRRPRVAADVSGPAVARAVELRVGGDGEGEHALRPEHAGDFRQRLSVVFDVLEHLAEDGGIEAFVL